MICLPREQVDEFLDKIKSGDLNPGKLSEMTSDERHAYFKEFLGDANAQGVNALFESKLLLKDQQRGILNWARSVSGLKPEVLRDIMSRVNRMSDVLQPDEAESFYKDLASQKLGVNVTMEEAAKVSQLAGKASDLKSAIKDDSVAGSPDRMAYGRAKVDFDNYIRDLKGSNKPATSLLGKVGDGLKIARAIRTTGDISVLLHQGIKTALSEPGIWAKNALQAFRDLGNSFGGKEVLDEVKADIASRPNALNGLYKKEGLAVGVHEEAIPTRLQEKIPFLGRVLKATDEAYTAFQYRTRADVFDKYAEIAQKTGGDIKGIGSIVNSLTGRGDLGKKGEMVANAINVAVYPPRLLKSDFDVLTGHVSDLIKEKLTGKEGDLGSFARKRAAINMVKVISGMAGIMTIANLVSPGSAEKDPRSSDFGKIKVGDTRFDFSGGMGSMVTLAARLATMSEKSATTGEIEKLNTGGFGAPTGLGVVENFITGRAAPLGSLVINWLNGQDFNGNSPFSPTSLAGDFMPFAASDYMAAAKDPNSANALAVLLGTELGIFPNTYTTSANWSQDPGVELQQFRDSVGVDKFQQANAKYNTQYNAWIKAVKSVPQFKNATAAEQAKIITKKKTDLKTSTMRSYGFTYKKEASTPIPKL